MEGLLDVVSALAVPAPDGGVVTHGDKDAAVTAEAGLADGGGATGQRQRGAPGGTAVTLVRGNAGAQQEQQQLLLLLHLNIRHTFIMTLILPFHYVNQIIP